MKKITRIKKKIKKIHLYLKQLTFINCIIFGLFIIILVVLFTDTSYMDNAIRCNEIKGKYCNKYEVEKYSEGK